MERRRQSQGRRKPRATTQEVLGSTEVNQPIKPKWRTNYARLQELRDLLQQSRSELNRDALEEQPSYSTHMADAGTDNYDRDFALGMLSAEQDAVYEVDQALERIRNNTYGVCELTGKPIEPERLAAVPWTRFSAAAEQQLERDGLLKGPRLGPRETVKANPAGTVRESE
jgi:DnaK suppressor protein